MLPALNIPALVTTPCPIPLASCSFSTALRAFSPWGLLNITFFFPVLIPIPLPIPLPFLHCLPLPLPVVSRLPFPLAILGSVPVPGCFLTALHVLLTLAVIIVIAIASTAPSTARCSTICPVLINIICVDYLIPIQLSHGGEVSWFVLRAASRLNCCPEIIATVPRETIAGGFNCQQAGCLRIGVIDMIPKGTGIVPRLVVHLVVGFVKQLPSIWAEDSPPRPKRRTPARAVQPPQLEL